jgi:hypothetical protein
MHSIILLARLRERMPEGQVRVKKDEFPYPSLKPIIPSALFVVNIFDDLLYNMLYYALF